MREGRGRGLVAGVACLLLPAAASASHPGIDELLGLLDSGSLTVPGELTLCHVGLGQHALELSRRLLGAAPHTRVAFLRPPAERLGELRALTRALPGRALLPSGPEGLGAGCSLLLLAPEDPRFTAEELREAAGGAPAVLAHLAAECGGERSHACRFFHAAWASLVGHTAVCGEHLCTAHVATAGLEDPGLAVADCAALRDAGRPPSTFSQWQQDWFIYQNFVRGTGLDGPGAGREGVFVDVGAFHPVHLSNTFFFERCLGWRGLCAEPNPSWAPYFSAYRPRCQLVPNCVWSRPRSAVMSFQKDPIEAYIQEEPGAVPVQGNGSSPRFAAECRTLEEILSSAGLGRPARVDYLSVDAEAAELEIFRDFPFEAFDISVVSVEVQARNYYELDAVFSAAGYAKLAVLGGDHVYARLAQALAAPEGAAEWRRVIARDFHAHAPPRSAVGRSA